MQTDGLTEVKLSSDKIYDGAIVHLEKWQVRLPNGRTASREVIRHVGAAAVVAVDDSGRVCLVRQYRAPLGRVTLEIPAGKLDQFGADRFETAVRELKEETGLSAEKWTHLGDIATTPGFCDEIIGLYLARGLSSGQTHPDEDEFLNVEFIPFAKALEMVYSGKIQDAKTVSALLLAQPRLT